MNSLTNVNPQILDAVTQTNKAVLGAAKAEGAGIAYQAVAQATAMAVQDAVEYMRNVNAVAATTIGIALEKMVVEKQVDPWAEVLTNAQNAVASATANLASVGTASTTIINNFPSS